MHTRIKAVRQSTGMTQKAFAETLGITRDALSTYETNRNAPSFKFIKILCHTYQINEGWLRTGEGDMHSESTADFVRRITAEHGSGFYALKVLECYLNLDDEHKEVVGDYIRALSQALKESDSIENVKVILAVEKTLIEMALK